MDTNCQCDCAECQDGECQDCTHQLCDCTDCTCPQHKEKDYTVQSDGLTTVMPMKSIPEHVKRAVPKRMGVQFRSASIDPTKVNVESRSIDVAFSSEQPVDRAYGREVLDHTPKSVRMNRMSHGAALLFNHNPDQHIGVVETARVGPDRIGRATVRFGNSAFAQEKFQDVQDGILRGISVGYLVHRMAFESEGPDAETGDTYRVNDWEPVEITLTPVPADPSVGVGRSADGAHQYPVVVDRHIPARPVKEQQMENEKVAAPAVDTAKVVNETRELEVARVRGISMICRQFAEKANLTPEDESRWLSEGTPQGQVNKEILERIVDQQKKQTVRTAPTVDLTDKEAKKFSMMRLIQHVISRSEGTRGPDASFELEVVAATEKKFPSQRGGLVLPTDLKFETEVRAGLVSNTNAAGGFSVQTTLQSLIELLRNRMVVKQAGATVLTGLTDTIAFPKQLTPGQANWVAENPAVDNVDADMTLGQILMSPKMLTSSTSYSRKLLAQSSLDIEALVRNDLVAVSAIALDLAALNGTGTANQPTGILNQAGINLITFAANGGAPSYADFVAMETLIAGQNADIGSEAYIVTPEVRGFGKRTVKVAGQILGTIVESDGSINGYPAFVTNQLPKNLVRGTASDDHAGIFGVWSSLMIGEWGSIELIVDPYRLKKQGMIEIASYLMADIAVRYPNAFSASKYWSAATL